MQVQTFTEYPEVVTQHEIVDYYMPDYTESLELRT